MPDEANFIDIRELKRYFTMGDNVVKALDGVDLKVERGELLCLMGPSGSGKTTLLNLLGGLDTPTEGMISVEGQEITTLDENGLAVYRQKMIGFVFQSFNLLPTMTALQNVEYPMVFASIPIAKRRERALDALDKVGLSDRMHHKPTELSGGQQQRVAMARAMVNRPQILVGDEPTGNLDTTTGEEVLEMLKALNDEGQTIILVTHDYRVSAYATRTIQMLDGKIISDKLASG